MAMSGAALQPPNVIPSTPRRGVLHQMRKQWSAYLFLAPTMILFGIFTVLAVIYAFYLSFHEWNILEPEQPYVGLDNYARLLRDDRFGGSFPIQPPLLVDQRERGQRTSCFSRPEH